jgi:hypothetical protein
MITKLLHDITQEGYEVQFNDDFEGMLTVTYYQPYCGRDGQSMCLYQHVSFPGSTMDQLDARLIESLDKFLIKVRNERAARGE